MSTPKYRWRVDIIESERGWGQKVVDTKFFDREVEAQKFVKEFNSRNKKSDTVPDWYMYATSKKVRVG